MFHFMYRLLSFFHTCKIQLKALALHHVCAKLHFKIKIKKSYLPSHYLVLVT